MLLPYFDKGPALPLAFDPEALDVKLPRHSLFGRRRLVMPGRRWMSADPVEPG